MLSHHALRVGESLSAILLTPQEKLRIAVCGILRSTKNGKFTLNHDPKKFTSVADYLKKQSRFRHLTDEDIQIIIQSRDEKWEKIRRDWRK